MQYAYQLRLPPALPGTYYAYERIINVAMHINIFTWIKHMMCKVSIVVYMHHMHCISIYSYLQAIIAYDTNNPQWRTDNRQHSQVSRQDRTSHTPLDPRSDKTGRPESKLSLSAEDTAANCWIVQCSSSCPVVVVHTAYYSASALTKSSTAPTGLIRELNNL